MWTRETIHFNYREQVQTLKPSQTLYDSKTFVYELGFK